MIEPDGPKTCWIHHSGCCRSRLSPWEASIAPTNSNSHLIFLNFDHCTPIQKHPKNASPWLIEKDKDKDKGGMPTIKAQWQVRKWMASRRAGLEGRLGPDLFESGPCISPHSLPPAHPNSPPSQPSLLLPILPKLPLQSPALSRVSV